jgi:hypothetical protein
MLLPHTRPYYLPVDSLRTGSQVKWEPASMTNEFEYLRLKSWREILIGQML